jgi:hypothetical protein
MDELCLAAGPVLARGESALKEKNLAKQDRNKETSLVAVTVVPA